MPCPNVYQNIASYEIWEEMVLFHIGKRKLKIKSNSLWQVIHCLFHTFRILKHLQITKKSGKWKFTSIKTLPKKFHYFSIFQFFKLFFKVDWVQYFMVIKTVLRSFYCVFTPLEVNKIIIMQEL
jgi:hypothetical protein